MRCTAVDGEQTHALVDPMFLRNHLATTDGGHGGG